MVNNYLETQLSFRDVNVLTTSLHGNKVGVIYASSMIKHAFLFIFNNYVLVYTCICVCVCIKLVPCICVMSISISQLCLPTNYQKWESTCTKRYFYPSFQNIKHAIVQRCQVQLLYKKKGNKFHNNKTI